MKRPWLGSIIDRIKGRSTASAGDGPQVIQQVVQIVLPNNILTMTEDELRQEVQELRDQVFVLKNSLIESETKEKHAKLEVELIVTVLERMKQTELARTAVAVARQQMVQGRRPITQ